MSCELSNHLLKKNLKIKFLADCQHHIPQLVRLHLSEINRYWAPDNSFNMIKDLFENSLGQHEMPITFVALLHSAPIGMVSLRKNDSLKSDFSPWLGSLVVDPKYRKNGIGEKLVDVAKNKAKGMKFKKLYLFTLNPTIHDWYKKLGWKVIGKNLFRQYPANIMSINL